MLLTSLLGVIASPHWPERWISVRTFPAVDANDLDRLWQIQSFARPGWSDVMASRFKSKTTVGQQAFRERDAEVDLGGVVSDRLRRGDPLPVVHADGADWWREYATGWPRRAWRGGDVTVVGPGGYTTQSFSKITFRDPTGMSRFGYVVPHGPVWSGIVLNSLVGAVGVWLMAVLPGAVRRARYRRRGRCVACGYDLAGVDGGVCPECGAERGKPKAEEASWA